MRMNFRTCGETRWIAYALFNSRGFGSWAVLLSVLIATNRTFLTDRLSSSSVQPFPGPWRVSYRRHPRLHFTNALKERGGSFEAALKSVTLARPTSELCVPCQSCSSALGA